MLLQRHAEADARMHSNHSMYAEHTDVAMDDNDLEWFKGKKSAIYSSGNKTCASQCGNMADIDKCGRNSCIGCKDCEVTPSCNEFCATSELPNAELCEQHPLCSGCQKCTKKGNETHHAWEEEEPDESVPLEDPVPVEIEAQDVEHYGSGGHNLNHLIQGTQQNSTGGTCNRTGLWAPTYTNWYIYEYWGGESQSWKKSVWAYHRLWWICDDSHHWDHRETWLYYYGTTGSWVSIFYWFRWCLKLPGYSVEYGSCGR